MGLVHHPTSDNIHHEQSDTQWIQSFPMVWSFTWSLSQSTEAHQDWYAVCSPRCPAVAMESFMDWKHFHNAAYPKIYVPPISVVAPIPMRAYPTDTPALLHHHNLLPRLYRQSTFGYYDLRLWPLTPTSREPRSVTLLNLPVVTIYIVVRACSAWAGLCTYFETNETKTIMNHTTRHQKDRDFFGAGIELYNPAARRAAPSGIYGRTALATRAGVCPLSSM
jgi:hypothetical protein